MRNNPTRRGGIDYSRCQCGFSRKLNKWVRNGCHIHPLQALEALERKAKDVGQCR